MTSALPVERVVVLDPDFGRMAVEAGEHAVGLPGLTLREKAFTWIASDVCHGHLGLPFELHLTVARQTGAGWAELREVLRHLAPYAGYPAVVEAFARLTQIQGPQGDPGISALDTMDATEPALPIGVDADFARWATMQHTDRWCRPLLTHRERALLCVAVDVLQQTLGAPLSAHVRMALAAGANAETLRALLRVMGELGMSKVWQAFPELENHLRHSRNSAPQE
ncbi:carboxymuconolactone decarboxylase family protein [Streptosporangium sp. NPDC087985]|uniref:carboxymuconolactone decarboxylase family protein n=1 Tax=Streptosporangium sp. NPDC087985 TaxID=3366196 RepID=UPI003827A999